MTQSFSETSAHRIARLLERVGRLMRARESAGDLNPAQWEALRFLGRANRFSRRPTTVAAWLASTKGTTSQTLLALERKGLITRVRDDGDRRGTQLELSEQGRELAAQDPLQALTQSMSRLPPLHAAALSQSLVHILADLAGPDGLQGFENCHTCLHFRDVGSTCLRFLETLSPAETHELCAFNEPAS